jgi:hypothetical protein
MAPTTCSTKTERNSPKKKRETINVIENRGGIIGVVI